MAASYGVEDVGKIISDMQDELQDFKMAIENMPGIGKGKRRANWRRYAPSTGQTSEQDWTVLG